MPIQCLFNAHCRVITTTVQPVFSLALGVTVTQSHFSACFEHCPSNVRHLSGGFASLSCFPSMHLPSCPHGFLPSWCLRFLRLFASLRLTYDVGETQEKVHFVAHVSVFGTVRGRARVPVLGLAQGVG